MEGQDEGLDLASNHQPGRGEKESSSKEDEELTPNHHPRSGEKKETSFKERLKDKEYKRKFIHSLVICGSFFVLGAGVGQMGPTFIDLQIITDSDLEDASAFFTFGSVGYLCGSAVCGLVFGKMNPDILMCLSTVVFGAAAVITPYCSIYEMMIFIRFVGSCAGGFIDTGGNTLHIQLWGTEGEGLMQFLHFCFAIGGVLSPLYSEHFLAPKSIENNCTGSGSTVTVNETSFSLNGTDSCGNASSISILPKDTDVKYAFMITGALSLICAVPFVFLYFSNRKNEDRITSEASRMERELPKPLMVLTVLMICFFYLLYCCVEDSFASFLMTFLVKEFDSVSKSKGAFATAIYWASFATARFLMVFLCRLLSSLKILAICIVMMLLTYTGFVVCAQYGAVDALLVCAAFAGLSMSAVFPAGFSWTESYVMRVNGLVSAAILVSSSTGTMTNPIILGYLMAEVDNMWFAYLLLVQTVMLALMFLVLLAFSQLYLNKRFGPCHPSPSITAEVPVQESFLNDRNREEVAATC